MPIRSSKRLYHSRRQLSHQAVRIPIRTGGHSQYTLYPPQPLHTASTSSGHHLGEGAPSHIHRTFQASITASPPSLRRHKPRPPRSHRDPPAAMRPMDHHPSSTHRAPIRPVSPQSLVPRRYRLRLRHSHRPGRRPSHNLRTSLRTACPVREQSTITSDRSRITNEREVCPSAPRPGLHHWPKAQTANTDRLPLPRTWPLILSARGLLPSGSWGTGT